MRPAHLTATCGTALALCLASPCFAQSGQPERPSDNVRLAQPTRTPTAREVDATARSGDTALALFEGVWKVDVVMMQGRDSRWDIPGTSPSDPNSPTSDSPTSITPTERPRDPASRTSDQPGSMPDRSNPESTTRQPTAGAESNAMHQGSAFTAYAESRVIMNGNVLQETMVLPREAAMMHTSATGSTSERTPSTRTPTASTSSSTPGGSGTAAVPQPVTPSQNRGSGLDPSLSEDTVTITSFLSLDSSSGTFTKVCMDEESGQIKHESGTYETESDRIVFTGHDAGDGATRDGAMRDGAMRDDMRDPLDRTRPLGSPDSAVLREPGASRPSADAPSTSRDPASGISGSTRPGTTPDQSTSTTLGSGSPENSGTARTRSAADGRSMGGWDSTWGKDCRVVVDILGPNERRVTVYKIDPSMPGKLIPGSPESGAGAGANRQSGERDDGVARTTPETDQVRAKAIVAGQIVCQATYTRVSGTEAESVRRIVRENNAFASSDRD
jgi:hypothetical protein